MARSCWLARRHAHAIWVGNSNGTNGRVGVQNSSLSKLLRWDWNLEKSIATGTHSVCRQSISDSWLGNLREFLAHLVEGSGCDCLLMQAASLLDGFSFDLFPPFKNGLAAPEVDVSRRQVVQALVISTVVVVPDELLDALFELSWQVVVVQQDPVFHRAMISLDFALRHRVVRPAADMSDAVVLEPLAKLARHVGWTVIAQQPWPMQNLDLVQT